MSNAASTSFSLISIFLALIRALVFQPQAFSLISQVFSFVARQSLAFDPLYPDISSHPSWHMLPPSQPTFSSKYSPMQVLKHHA
jgi:hypothetical protein